jgi:hypothetical protein
MQDAAADLESRGYAVVGGGFESSERAWRIAQDIIDRCCTEVGSVSCRVIGNFVIPPGDGPASRDFQTLHFDFGLPIDPKVTGAIARYTALHIADLGREVSAQTRLVPLAPLLAQRTWHARERLVSSMIAYGRTHGAWNDADGYVEGSLARIIEAAAGISPALPSVKTDSAFLCGLEFDTLKAEVAFFSAQGLDLESVEHDIALPPGGLLIFDNLAVAHGRRGTRQPGELHQRVFGHEAVSPRAQRELRDQVISAFFAGDGHSPGILWPAGL